MSEPLHREPRPGRPPPSVLRPVTLHTGDLVLRPWRAGDAPAVRRICQDPAIQRFTRVPSPYTLADAQAFVGPGSSGLWTAGEAASWAVTAAADGRVLGSIGLHRALTPEAEIGYWAAPEARGAGVMTAAAREVCRWAFEELSAARLWWRAVVGNEASWRVARQVGFHYEGRERLTGTKDTRPQDRWMAGLLPGEVRHGRVPLPFEPDGPFLGLTDGEVSLRRWTEGDLAAYRAMRNEPSVRAWGAHGAEINDAETFYEVCVLGVEAWMLGSSARFAICLDETPVGGLSLRPDISHWQSPESMHGGCAQVGWWLGSGARGRGVAARAQLLQQRWAFEELGLARLEARVHELNTPSRALALRLGFAEVGLLARDAPQADGGRGAGVLFERVSPA